MSQGQASNLKNAHGNQNQNVLLSKNQLKEFADYQKMKKKKQTKTLFRLYAVHVIVLVLDFLAMLFSYINRYMVGFYFILGCFFYHVMASSLEVYVK
mmetsp:Transcript_35680/g.26498  ORF Transcript_35680/g.26498 Transcript_35680/m.26498 type:complete len:97 (-) Transcript_35680:595-885(-)